MSYKAQENNTCTVGILPLLGEVRWGRPWEAFAYPVSQKGSHVKLKHDIKSGIIIFPNHGSQEVGKGLEKKILKDANITL